MTRPGLLAAQRRGPARCHCLVLLFSIPLFSPEKQTQSEDLTQNSEETALGFPGFSKATSVSLSERMGFPMHVRGKE